MIDRQRVIQMAVELGFDLVGCAPAGPTPGAQAFVDWLASDYGGEMQYLHRDPAKRLDPRNVLPAARSVVVVGVSYDTQAVPREVLVDPSRGRIARYAWGRDYHDLITPPLRTLGERLARESRAYVDTGPLLERAWAERCGLGFIGRNTCLIHRTRGSYLFLGAVLLAEEITDLPEASEEPGHAVGYTGHRTPAGCGQCRRCLDACPTRAFAAAGVLDARRCISYLTIELKGAIPVELRPMMGNWVFGCDVCQDVCPYVRRFSRPTRERAFYPPDAERAAPLLLDLLALDRCTFNARYKGTPLLRARRRGIVRNACIAAGNWGSPAALPTLERLLLDEEPLVREHAAWAISRIKSHT